MSEPQPATVWARVAYRNPAWTMKVGWPDGYARTHWTPLADAERFCADGQAAFPDMPHFVERKAA